MKRSLFGLLSELMVYYQMGYFNPILTTHLTNIKFKPEVIGLLVTLIAITAIVSLIVNQQVMKYIAKRMVIYIGFTMLCISISIISLKYDSENVMTMYIVAVLLYGYGFGSVILPLIPEILDALEQDASK